MSLAIGRLQPVSESSGILHVGKKLADRSAAAAR